MAALLLPLAFAGAGYLGFGSTGAAVGWLIGAWLFGPKATTENQIFDPGAQEMPRFNQSLRGVTIPILFGTNRVASNVVWVNNFQTIRKETTDPQQGGGKAGGSGGGMKGGGQSTNTQVSYEYKWDMLFHIGMGPEPYGIFGGWVNTQRLSGDTVLAIINNASGVPPISSTDTRNTTFVVGSGTSQAVQSSNTASLTFDDSFYGPGGPTGNDSYPAWDYFEAQVGQPARWPYTYYVGFKALSLGSSPAVPQLQWEIGPGDAVLTRDPTVLSNTQYVGLSGHTNNMLVGEDGNHYVGISGGNGNDADDLTLWCLETGAYLHKALSTLPLNGSTVPSSGRMCIGGGSPYVLHLGIGFPGGISTTVHAILYKVDSTGALVAQQTYTPVASDLDTDLGLGDPIGFGFMSFDAIMSQSSGHLVWVFRHSVGAGGKKIMLLVLKYQGVVAQASTSYPILDDFNWKGGQGSDLTLINIETNDNIGYSPDGMFYGDHESRAFILPEYHPENSPLINNKWPISYWICMYVNKAEIAADTGTSPIITANKTLYPDGFVVGWRLTGTIMDYALESATIINDKFCDAQGQALTTLFDDSGLRLDGTTAQQDNDYYNPSITVTTQGGIVLTFPKMYVDGADQGSAGSYLKLRVFVWNPSASKATEYTNSEGAWFDQVTDLGVTFVDGNVPVELQPFYDINDGNMYVVGDFAAAQDVNNRVIGSIWGPMSVGGGADVLPPYIIYQILTNPVFGMGIPEADIDQTTYQLVLQSCDAQNIRVSVQYTREEDILGAIEDLLALYGGYLIDSGGKVRFGIVTTESSLNPVRVIDNHHLIPPKPGDPPVTVTKGAKQDGYNKVRVNYFDRSLDYRQNQFEIGDEVDQDLNGVRFKELPPKFVMKVDMAASVAERALWTNLYARDTYQFKLGWKDADLEPGDVITLVDSFHPELAGGKNVRIAHWEEKERGKFDVMAVIEIPYYMTASHDTTLTNSIVSNKGRSDQVLPCSDFRMYELPREYQTSGGKLYVGYNQQSNIRGATLWLSPDGVTYTVAQNAEPYVVSGIFAQPLPAKSQGNVEFDVDMYIMPSSGFSAATPTYCQTLALDDVSPEARAAGGGILICGSEAMAMENLTLRGQNFYRIGRLYRGWGGTKQQHHSSGAYFHRHAGGIFATDINVDKIGTKVWYKVAPYNFAGEAYDISSITGKEYMITGGYWLPQVQPNLKVFIADPADGLGAVDMRNNYYRSVISGGTDVTIQWADCARLDGYGFQGYGNGGYGHFLADADAHQWRVEVLRSDVVVRSTVVSTPSYTYLIADNSADFVGFSAEFQFRVTPFNIYGDAPDSIVRSLHCFSGALAAFVWSANSITWDSTVSRFDQR